MCLVTGHRIRHKKITALFLLLSGCVFNTAPENNADFKEAASIQDLVGVYQNAGDPVGNLGAIYLSAILWSNSSFPTNNKDLTHKDIQYIQVEAIENGVNISAIANKCVLFKNQYIKGDKFDISGGKLIIKRDVNPLTRGAGDVLLGPSYESVKLGIDTHGDGKYRSYSVAAGLVFLMVPVAASETIDIRFKKDNIEFIHESCR